MPEMKPTMTGTVMMPGTFAPANRLNPGRYRITLEAVDPENGYDAGGNPLPSEHQMVRCVYPDGFSKHHQLKDVDGLVARVAMQMRSHYGAGDVNIVDRPKKLKAGATIEVEI